MKKQLALIEIDRRRLLERIQLQRYDVKELTKSFRKTITPFEIGFKTTQYLVRHPALVAGSFAVVLTLWRQGMSGLKSLLPPPVRYLFWTMLNQYRIQARTNEENDNQY